MACPGPAFLDRHDHERGRSFKGLNTAATLRGSAGIGAFARAGLIVEAAIVAEFVLGGTTLLRPIVNTINRRPVSAEETQALSQVQLL